ncbi:4-hydroxythreonine-4-phosphate dehydrogenase PdxA [Moraxella nasovis]|uniref:4-hydroxythreonine-4-phosphate dehydrogenase PdxA n=1 Tax=Moraxella nasovis TaxID=2904121 RepID=UPI001F611293|nr:4-hydroxythreonine-4-phosphate dehydrogenase PdxA [Moraxella nasovis]UNU73161.1 4-hydroxythreonine-4-phosphate dehydrogenase PdxA [Moraxella nasovis]
MTAKSSLTLPKPLLITTGEPAGIGMDIVIDVLVHHKDTLPYPLWIIADACAFDMRARTLLALAKITALPSYQMVHIDDSDGINQACCDVLLIDVPCADKVVAGVLNPNNAKMVERQLSFAHAMAKAGVVSGVVTCPIQKSVMVDGGISLGDGTIFSGHTEYFMQKAECQKVVMMLANHTMRVALVTTHLPLKDVASAITPDEIRQTIQITHDALTKQFGIAHPKILVCGLNPHAGESGALGLEEIEIINPVLQDFINQGFDVSLALPADTLFTKKHIQDADVIIAMYHDQGLPVLKSHGFGDTVNITLGLPYVRTSVDHGTALSLAGTGTADSSSLRCAISLAIDMS